MITSKLKKLKIFSKKSSQLTYVQNNTTQDGGCGCGCGCGGGN